MRRNAVFGVRLDNVIAWGRREALQIATADIGAIETEARGLIESAVREGTGLEEFERDFADALSARGLSPVAPWHAETIFRTNSLSAYAGGEWANAKSLEASGDIVAARYVAVLDDRTRPAHAAMDGWWGRLDDPVWETWWPPNGWNCRCFVVLLTQADVDALGGWDAQPQAPAVFPDPGFDGNPGTGIWRIVSGSMVA